MTSSFHPSWPAVLGARPAGERLARIRSSPHFSDGAFRNPEPTRRAARGAWRSILRHKRATAGLRRPLTDVPVVRRTAADYLEPPAGGLRLTWLGHATVLAEIDGRRVLFDPVWSTRCSPSAVYGPARLHAMPLRWAQLPYVDAVVISHDHYDHLDMATVQALTGRDVTFVVPLGVGAHLERWGVPAGSVVELDWHEETRVAGLTFTATPARHYCNRGARILGTVLWASWVVAGPVHRVFHSGDTGWFDALTAIGEAHGPFDVTMIQAGAYAEAWPDVHLTPEDAVRAHTALGGELMLPIHWATFDLAPHPWAEPAERVLAAATRAGVKVVLPRPGEFVEPGRVTAGEDLWWRPAAGIAAGAPLGGPHVGGDLVGEIPGVTTGGQAAPAGGGPEERLEPGGEEAWGTGPRPNGYRREVLDGDQDEITWTADAPPAREDRPGDGPGAGTARPAAG